MLGLAIVSIAALAGRSGGEIAGEVGRSQGEMVGMLLQMEQVCYNPNPSPNPNPNPNPKPSPNPNPDPNPDPNQVGELLLLHSCEALLQPSQSSKDCGSPLAAAVLQVRPPHPDP